MRYAGLDGRIVRESAGTSSKTKAQALLEERKTQVRHGRDPGTRSLKPISFEAFAAQYREWSKQEHPSYTHSMRYNIDRLVRELGHLPITRIGTAEVDRLQAKLGEEGSGPSHINRVVGCLKAMITKAEAWGYVGELAVRAVRKVKPKRETQRVRYLRRDEDEDVRLVRACKEPVRAFVLTVLATGMRRAEVLNLRWAQVDLKQRMIHLAKTKNGNPRSIRFEDDLLEVLTSQRSHWEKSEWVFPNPQTGKPYTSIAKAWTMARKEAGLVDFHFHDLRATYASWLVMDGIDIRSVQYLLGHRSLEMTMRYARLNEAHAAHAAVRAGTLAQLTQKLTQACEGTCSEASSKAS